MSSNNHPLNLRNQTLRSSLRRERQKSPGRKTVSFCSQNTEKKVSNVNDCLQIMKNGTELVKLRTNVRQFCRVFSLDSDNSYIRWSPTNKKPHKARISVESIKEVRMGRNTELLRATENSNTDLQDECAFSIIYGTCYECLDLIALTPDDANIWVTGLMALTSTQRADFQPENGMATIREQWISSMFIASDKDKKGYISEKSAVRLVCELNPRLTVGRVKQKVKEASALGLVDNNRGHIGCDEFVEIYKDISTRPEIYFLMVRYANKDYLSCEDLQIFLETEQGMIGVGRLFCEELIQQYEPSPEAKEKHCMTVDGFTNYLHSKTNTVFDPAHYNICQEMDRPFSEYFIATSYNTYLVEDQTSGPSSIDGYITALKRNCRFVELNLWDPLDEADPQEPLVCRSSTVISKITLTSVLQTIKTLAFEKTRYPLFMRIDVHLSTEWQVKACEILHNVLEDKLYQPLLDSTDWSDPANIPTPTHFLGKIILVSTCYKSRSTELPPPTSADDDDENSEKNQKLCSQFLEIIPSFGKMSYIRDNISYSDMGKLNAHRDIFSICESSCLKLIQSNSSIFGHLSRNFLLRTTPNLTRVDSSNMNPQEFWNFGVNLCAMNYQTPGLMMDLQEGKFAANGGCGYVLKPKIMNDEVFSPVDKMPFTPQILHLRIISAQQLPRPRASNAKGDSTDAFVVVEVFGIPADCAEERTKTVRNDNSPKFEESFQFEVCIPEIALVRFLVLDDEFVGDDFIGQCTIPFDCLQSGYRHIQLLNNEGETLQDVTLFVHIAITNRRGGGKPKKRGMSVKRKQNHVQTGMKIIGIKAADDLFKAISDPLVESIEMRNQLEGALTKWQELCGIGQTSTMRQGLRLLHNRINSAAAETSPTSPTKQVNESSSAIWVEQTNDQKLIICTQPDLPDPIQKCVAALENLLAQCAQSNSMDEVIEKLSDSNNKISDFYMELPHVCEENSMRGQKAQRAVENFAWNVRLLKAQFTLASKTQTESKEIVQQLIETAKSLGVFREKNDLTPVKV